MRHRPEIGRRVALVRGVEPGQPEIVEPGREAQPRRLGKAGADIEIGPRTRQVIGECHGRFVEHQRLVAEALYHQRRGRVEADRRQTHPLDPDLERNAVDPVGSRARHGHAVDADPAAPRAVPVEPGAKLEPGDDHVAAARIDADAVIGQVDRAAHHEQRVLHRGALCQPEGGGGLGHGRRLSRDRAGGKHGGQRQGDGATAGHGEISFDDTDAALARNRRPA